MIRLKDINTHPVGDMLAASENMEPYINHYGALVTDGESEQTLKAIASLPVEKRYITRVMQCLDWALADFDSETVKLDLPYLPELAGAIETLRLRAWQAI